MGNAVLVQSYQSVTADTIETVYTSPPAGAGTIITAFTATNNTASNRTYRAYIYAADGLSLSAVVPLKIVVIDRFDSGAGIVNHLIEPGGILKFESDLASSISLRVSGKEL